MREPALEPARHPGAALISVDGRTYPLESARIVARAEGGVVESKLVQRFANPHDEPLEVVYTLPLPADGAVLGYTIRMGEKVIRGEIESREKAEARYKEALFDGKTAGLLEQDRADTFTQRLGNLPPRTAAEIEIQVLHPLAFLPAVAGAEPKWEYRFPTVVGVRYQGDPGRVADAERLDVDRDAGGNIPTRVEFELAIAGWPGGEARVESLDHDLRVETAGDTATAVLMHAARLDRDFVVRWAACAQGVGVRMAVGGGLPGDDGCYGLLTVTPPAAPAVTYARDLTLLIDASGSMSGEPIATAKSVVTDLLSGLASEDRFEVLTFANAPTRLTKDMTPATRDAVDVVVRLVNGVTAGGGTEMATALAEALKPLRPGAQRQVILVTDGDIGFEDEVLRTLADGLPPGARLHCVGIGAAPNRTLTCGLARAGRGVELFARDEETAREAARRLAAATVRPVLTEISVGGSAVRKVAPERPRDVFAGQPLVMTAELDPRGGTVEVHGRLAAEGSATPWARALEIPAGGAVVASAGVSASPLPIGALYGREAIADVEAELRGRDHEPRLRAIEQLGLRHRITSRCTSLVAIAEEPSVDPTAPRRRERLAVELPMGVSAMGVGLMGPRMLAQLAGGPRAAALGAPGLRLIGAIPRVVVELARRAADHARAQGFLPPALIDRVTVTKMEKRILELEFESPGYGFTIPAGDVKVLVGGREVGVASVIPARSTRGKTVERGLLVKLALELRHGKKWDDWHEVALSWVGDLETPGGGPCPLSWELKVALPPVGNKGPR